MVPLHFVVSPLFALLGVQPQSQQGQLNLFVALIALRLLPPHCTACWRSKGVSCDDPQVNALVKKQWLLTRAHAIFTVSEMARIESNLSLFLNPVNVGNKHRWQGHLELKRKTKQKRGDNVSEQRFCTRQSLCSAPLPCAPAWQNTHRPSFFSSL